MAGSLVLIQETTVSSPVSSVSLIGTNSSEFDVYFVQVIGVEMSSQVDMTIRFTVSGTADSSSNYDYGYLDIRSANTYAEVASANDTLFRHNAIGTDTSETSNGTLYLFNFNNSSEFSFYTLEETMLSSVPEARGRQGGGALTVAQATDGVVFLLEASANFTAGSFRLYGLRK